MTDLLKRMSHLRAIWSRREPTLVVDFGRALSDVAELNDPGAIGLLLELFHDEPPSDDLMFEIVHAIERYPDHVYVEELLRYSEALLGRSPRWARILFMRVLNSAAARAELASAVRQSPVQTRAAVGRILADIEARRPEFASKTAQVRSSL